MTVRLSEDNFRQEVIGSKLPVLVDFYSDGCIPCKRMSPLLAELEEAYAGRFKLAKVNINFHSELAQAQNVLSAPTLIFFAAGAEKKRLIGLVSKDALCAAIEQILEEIA